MFIRNVNAALPTIDQWVGDNNVRRENDFVRVLQCTTIVNFHRLQAVILLCQRPKLSDASVEIARNMMEDVINIVYMETGNTEKLSKQFWEYPIKCSVDNKVPRSWCGQSVDKLLERTGVKKALGDSLIKQIQVLYNFGSLKTHFSPAEMCRYAGQMPDNHSETRIALQTSVGSFVQIISRYVGLLGANDENKKILTVLEALQDNLADYITSNSLTR
jgi:hypothetical protein